MCCKVEKPLVVVLRGGGVINKAHFDSAAAAGENFHIFRGERKRKGEKGEGEEREGSAHVWE